MKKIIMSLALLAALALPAGALAAAPDAAMFQKEEDTADLWAQSMLVQVQPGNARSLMSADAQKNIDEAKMKEISDKLTKQLGKLKTSRFVSWVRFDQADQMTYLMSFEKGNPMRSILIFNKQGGLENFVISQWPQPKQDQAAGNQNTDKKAAKK